ncbi:hypothetical protein EXE10_17505 [Acinetobacter sp. WCHAc060033]|uniref:STY1053 family phage-associated protein n=1 Tax=Acinetobacter sp. WCHAc060033 TaxID=2518624 RepID=UPI001022E522|nr:hypothetical protein [Acinetobacter sp. WCHAc060033]RZG78613.1 hypothetical protein EXE10_17505 [Acinetobacter sp. WCHAc060033]
MSKMIQILLSKQLTVNLGRDDQGEAKTVVLQAGLQEVEQSIAEHWFVKAHSQEITSSDVHSHELQEALDLANASIESLKVQSEAADKKIADLEKLGAEKDKAIESLKVQLNKASQVPENTKTAEPKAK